jgi:predicted PolB exonuclease-like 3'-5' exonuclease
MSEINVLVFDIETIPDVSMLRKLHGFSSELSDAEVVSQVSEKLKAEKGSDFLPLHLHQVTCISAVMRRKNDIRVWSLGDLESSEGDLIQRFFSGVEKYSPTLVSWNGSGFDLPVLHYRAMHHKISAPRYWEMGERDQSFKWNNYISRYHLRHTDLMDLLALYNSRAYVKLDEAAILMGFPGKMGKGGGSVWEEYSAGRLKGIRDYCETDVLNTYLLYLRFELMRGTLTLNGYERLTQELRAYLSQEGYSHFQEFLAAWSDC